MSGAPANAGTNPVGANARAWRKEGVGGRNSATPERNQTEASPAALLVKAMHHRKILFSLEEKEIRRAQNEKSKEYFSVVRRVVASGGGAASLVPFKKSSSKVYNYSTFYAKTKIASEKF